MALEAGLPLTPDVPARSEFRVLAATSKDILCSKELFPAESPGKKFPNLREDHTRLLAAGDPEKDGMRS